MSDESRPDFAAQLERCRHDPEAQGRLLLGYRPWLQLLARLQLGRRLSPNLDPSDLVQLTLLEGFRAWPRFAGHTEAELCAWLRGVLTHVVAHEIRRYEGTQQRDPAREVSFEQELADASERLGSLLIAPGSSPSQGAARQEEQVRLAAALQRLPDDYREVLVLRTLEGRPHEEVAVRMGRGVGAVRMLWLRALSRLRKELGLPSDP